MRVMIALAVIASVVGLTGVANGAIEGLSRLQVTDFGLYKPDMLDPTGLGDQVHSSDFASLSASFSSNTSATLNSAGSQTFLFVPSPDAPQAAVGSGFPAGPNPNNFSDTPTGSVFARGDTFGTGQIVAGSISGIPPGGTFGADVSTIAEVQLDSVSTNAGGSMGNVTSTAGFRFTLADPGFEMIADFDASGLLKASLDQPPGINANASYSFTMSITDSSNNVVFEWTPNGAAGGISGGTEIFDPWDMTANASQSFDGSTTVSHASQSFRATIDALPTGTYDFIITHTSIANARAILPEASALAVWGLLAGCAAAISVSRVRRHSSRELSSSQDS